MNNIGDYPHLCVFCLAYVFISFCNFLFSLLQLRYQSECVISLWFGLQLILVCGDFYNRDITKVLFVTVVVEILNPV